MPSHLTAAALLIVVVGAHSAAAADYPSRAVRFVAPEAGGAADTAARLIAQSLTRSFGVPVLVENRPGSGVIAGQAVATAAPDGHTVLLYGSTIWLLPLLQDHVPFDPLRDFAPVMHATTTPMLLVVNPALPVKSVKELIALARARPGELNNGSAGVGSANHLAPALFKSMARLNVVNIAYKGVASALTDLISGRLQFMMPAIASGMPHAKSGRLRALAVTSLQPTPLGPGLPTVAAAGLPGFEACYNLNVQVPAKTPAAIVSRLHEGIVRVLSAPEVKERLFVLGIETVGSTPEALLEIGKLEVAKWGKLIKEAGIRVQ